MIYYEWKFYPENKGDKWERVANAWQNTGQGEFKPIPCLPRCMWLEAGMDPNAPAPSPSEPVIPDGWERLGYGVQLKEGDMCICSNDKTDTWRPTRAAGQVADPGGTGLVYIRRIARTDADAQRLEELEKAVKDIGEGLSRADDDMDCLDQKYEKRMDELAADSQRHEKQLAELEAANRTLSEREGNHDEQIQALWTQVPKPATTGGQSSVVTCGAGGGTTYWAWTCRKCGISGTGGATLHKCPKTEIKAKCPACGG